MVFFIPFSTAAFRTACTASSAPFSVAHCRASTAPSSDTDLMSQRSQRSSARVTARSPCSRCAGDGRVNGVVIANTVGGVSAGNEKSRLATPRVTCQ